MKNEEKQALIEDCQREIAHLNRCIKSYPGEPVLKRDLLRNEIALAALTAQPVAWLVEFQETMTDDYCRSVKTVQLEKPTGHYLECATPLIRVASNEVQE